MTSRDVASIYFLGPTQRGIRLLIAFGNYWQHYGGTDQYNRWSYQAGKGTCDGEFACRDEFFSDPYAREMYKNHIRVGAD
jgi:hypothetical protein